MQPVEGGFTCHRDPVDPTTDDDEVFVLMPRAHRRSSSPVTHIAAVQIEPAAPLSWSSSSLHANPRGNPRARSPAHRIYPGCCRLGLGTRCTTSRSRSGWPGSSRRCCRRAHRSHLGSQSCTALFDAGWAGFTGVIETVHATELPEPTVELLGPAGAGDAAALAADLHGRAVLVGQAAVPALSAVGVAVDTKARGQSASLEQPGRRQRLSRQLKPSAHSASEAQPVPQRPSSWHT